MAWSFWSAWPARNAVDAGLDHLSEAVLGEVRVAGIIEGIGKGPGQADALVELADGEQPGITGELTLGWLDDQRQQLADRVRVALVDGVQDLGDVTHRHPRKACKSGAAPSARRPGWATELVTPAAV